VPVNDDLGAANSSRRPRPVAGLLLCLSRSSNRPPSPVVMRLIATACYVSEVGKSRVSPGEPATAVASFVPSAIANRGAVVLANRPSRGQNS